MALNASALFPASHGGTVTQAHTDTCASKGHATWTVNGEDNGICPRCGEVKNPAPEFTPEQEQRFQRLAHLEWAVRMSGLGSGKTNGMTIHRMEQERIGHVADKKRLRDAVDAMSLLDMRAYLDWKRQNPYAI